MHVIMLTTYLLHHWHKVLLCFLFQVAFRAIQASHEPVYQDLPWQTGDKCYLDTPVGQAHRYVFMGVAKLEMKCTPKTQGSEAAVRPNGSRAKPCWAGFRGRSPGNSRILANLSFNQFFFQINARISLWVWNNTWLFLFTLGGHCWS